MISPLGRTVATRLLQPHFPSRSYLPPGSMGNPWRYSVTIPYRMFPEQAKRTTINNYSARLRIQISLQPVLTSQRSQILTGLADGVGAMNPELLRGRSRARGRRS